MKEEHGKKRIRDHEPQRGHAEHTVLTCVFILPSQEDCLVPVYVKLTNRAVNDVFIDITRTPSVVKTQTTSTQPRTLK